MHQSANGLKREILAFRFRSYVIKCFLTLTLLPDNATMTSNPSISAVVRRSTFYYALFVTSAFQGQHVTRNRIPLRASLESPDPAHKVKPINCGEKERPQRPCLKAVFFACPSWTGMTWKWMEEFRSRSRNLLCVCCSDGNNQDR